MADAAKSALDQLQATFPGQVTTSHEDANYRAATQIPWSQTCWTEPAGYVILNDSKELQAAFAIICETGSQFAIRTTGHNPNAGFSSADKTAIVLDIRKFQSKELGADHLARIGAGNTWGEVYAWLEEQNRSAIGGRDPQVGVGGFLLGGGMGALPNLHGLGTDSVRNFEIMLSDGRLVEANASENVDLFRSLKGGGSNFGIVTRFDIETHPLINIKSAINLYQTQDYKEIIQATVKVQEAMETDSKIGLFTNFNNGFVAVGLLYADTTAELPAVFDSFRDLKTLTPTPNPASDFTLHSLAQAMGHAQEAKSRKVWTLSTKMSQDLYEEVYETWTKACQSLPTNAILHYTIQPVGVLTVQAGESRGGNIMGIESTPQCWWVFTCEWPKDSNDDGSAERAVDAMAENVKTAADTKGLLLKYLCMNFATGSQKVLSSYGPENVKAMRDVAEKYDPQGVFQKLQHGGFLLRNSI